MPFKMPRITRSDNCLTLGMSDDMRCDICTKWATSTRKHPAGKKPKCLQFWGMKIKPTTTFPKKDKKRRVLEELASKGYNIVEDEKKDETISSLFKNPTSKAWFSADIQHCSRCSQRESTCHQLKCPHSPCAPNSSTS